MSKLYNTYLELKKQNNQTIYLFKSGIFFIALDEDARFLSDTFHLKLVNFSDTIVKCGFPCSSFNKYSNLFKSHSLDVQVIEATNNISYTLKEYSQSQSVTELLTFIHSANVNNLSVVEAYQFISDLQKMASNIEH